MKYIVCLILVFIGGMLFLPRTGSTQIRNIPLLFVILFFILVIFMIGIFKYMVLMVKAKRILNQKGFKCVKFFFFPFGAMLHGRYNIIFQSEKKELNIVFLVKKKKYQNYFFKDINNVEFYRSNRVVFNNIKAHGATISKAVETKSVGKQKIKWKQYDMGLNGTNILLFDKLPFKISDSVKKEELGNGDRICSSNVYLFDLNGLQNTEHIFDQ